MDWSSYIDELEKVAVTLEELRQATKPLKPIHYRTRGRTPDLLKGLQLIKNAPAESTTPAWGKGKVTPKRLEATLSNAELAGLPAGAARKMLRSIGTMSRGIYTSGEPYKGVKTLMDVPYKGLGPKQKAVAVKRYGHLPHMATIPKLAPKAREAFNRATLLHEKSEIGKHPGRHRFASHLSLRPMLQDLNIAATLKGPGASAKRALKAMRAQETQMLGELVPATKRLRLGKQRLSRHAIKRLQGLYDKKVDKILAEVGDPRALSERGPLVGAKPAPLKPVKGLARPGSLKKMERRARMAKARSSRGLRIHLSRGRPFSRMDSLLRRVMRKGTKRALRR